MLCDSRNLYCLLSSDPCRDGPEDLAAVSLYTPVENIVCEIAVYTNPSNGPVSGSPVTTTSGTIEVPGYHTIYLASEATFKCR